MANLLLLNGPNLNLLGQREPDHYGATSLADIEANCRQLAAKSSHNLICLQSNSEGELIDKIHSALNEKIDFILFNPAGFTHTSVALRDALAAVKIPFIEIHLSNIHGREPFRKHSYFSDLAVGVISGLGATGYELAVQAAIAQLKQS
ncbi:MAG: type II 3-dehydroquinate dehydratase [Immundisolibacteraceae bacterium]|nr:type II 3-dehydroquinate dehydratase [Immundisolibacteraceae bacterium]